MQALTSPEDLRSLAPGCSVQQQLNALASLHARIAQGQPSVACEWLITEHGQDAAALQPHAHSFTLAPEQQPYTRPKGRCLALAPDGAAAAASWYRHSGQILGVQICAADASGVWSPAPVLHPCEQHYNSAAAAGVSSCGRWCAWLRAVDPADGPPVLACRLLDLQRRCWTSEATVQPHTDVRPVSICFSRDSSLVASILMSDYSRLRELAVFGVSAPFAWTSRSSQAVLDFVWLPQYSTLIALNAVSLARLIWARSRQQPSWTCPGFLCATLRRLRA